MKYRIFVCAVAAILVCFGIFGAVKRASYTDMRSDAGYLDNLQVGLIPGGLCAITCEEMAQSLPSAPIIARVTPVSDLENSFGLSRQKVRLRELYAGGGLSVGEVIYLTGDFWQVSLEPGGAYSLQRGFVNVLQGGQDYLVFLSGEMTSPMVHEDARTYRLFGESFIAPVFCYGDTQITIAKPLSETTTYTRYAQVKDSELFVLSEEGAAAFSALKRELFAQYPAGA